MADNTYGPRKNHHASAPDAASGASAHAAAIHERWDVSLYALETSSYASLHLCDERRPFWIVSHVVQGQVTMQMGEESWQVQAGQVMIHPPHIPFSESATGAGTHQWMFIDATTTLNTELFRRYAVTPVITLADTAQYAQTFAALEAVWRSEHAPLRALEAAALTYQLCVAILKEWTMSGAQQRPTGSLTVPDRFTEVILYMEQHLGEKITREQLAGLVHVHPSYFDRIFRATFEMAPMQMLRAIRLQQAQHLLESTDLSVSAIAERCGFYNTAHLILHYQQRFGQTPGQYRHDAHYSQTGDFYRTKRHPHGL